MGKVDNITAFFLVLCAFIGGYWIVSKLYQKFKLPRFENTEDNHGNNKFNDNNSGNRSRQHRNQEEKDSKRYSDRISYYDELLELRGDHSTENIKKKYREIISKYHPDKVLHLGVEFRQIAEKKSREINEAYAYFRQRYNVD